MESEHSVITGFFFKVNSSHALFATIICFPHDLKSQKMSE